MSTLRLGILIGAAVALSKFPLLFMTLGEQDQARLIVDAFVYLSDGPETFRRYGILTSPAWTLPLAGVMAVFGAARIVLLTNIGGWLCGALTTTLAFVLLRQLGASRAWSAAGAIGTGLVPGTFYISLYGYPSQYALPLLLAAAVAFAKALESRGVRWMLLSAVFYCGVTLMKIDFALTGTLLFSVAIVRRRVLDWRTWLLAVFPVIAFAAAYLIGRVAIHGQDLFGFLTHVGDVHPWSPGELVESHTSTVFYAAGFGTLALLVAAAGNGLVRRDTRAMTARITIAWLVGALPLLLFWLARPPMSTRHAMPAALMTVIVAALLAALLLPRARYAAIVWLLAVVGLNWPFGKPDFDFNYEPSGNLAAAVSVNRRAFAVAHDIARTVVEREEAMKAILGHPERGVSALGAIDFMPIILVEMAARSQSARMINMQWTGAVVFTGRDNEQTRVFIYMFPARAENLVRVRRAGFYAPWPVDLTPLTRHGIEVMTFDPDEMFKTAVGEYMWR
jgi:hypothetical protein